MTLTDMQKTIAATIFIGAVSVGGLTYLSTNYAQADDFKALKKRVVTAEQKQTLNNLIFDLKLARGKKELGATDQDSLIKFLEQQLIELEKELKKNGG